MKEVNALLEAIDIPTRSGGRRSIASCVSVGGFGATRSGESEVESPLYYIMNFENDEGFAVASHLRSSVLQRRDTSITWI